jgi:hypothetical protein
MNLHNDSQNIEGLGAIRINKNGLLCVLRSRIQIVPIMDFSSSTIKIGLVIIIRLLSLRFPIGAL